MQLSHDVQMPVTSLPPLPPGFAATRKGLHRVAEQIVAPARKPVNEIALQATPGGFGTPVFEWEGRSEQVRVAGVELVRETGGEERHGPLGSLRAAAELVADLLDEDPEALSDEPLQLDPAAAAALAAWYELGDAVLAQLRGAAGATEEATATSLWPEHFDIAIELGDESAGARANYGFSPGDEDHDEPYIYVGPWIAPPAGALWNAKGFPGAELGYSELRAAGDASHAAREFCESRRRALSKG